ncbi:MAG: lipopolysaccharide core heptose(II) kinase RfaY [Fulvivirga sp.]|uniref:lipopolysaccharide core heptose(II) kinase RfaY n=1 Tax=Fulvivirga sp. TaxID=1931237 RepID=UPI0032EF8F8D
MQLSKIEHKNWIVYYSPELSGEEAKELFERISNQQFEIVTVLKDNQRSIVKRINVNSRDLVLKVPKEKNSRFWIRFLTLFRSGEARKNLESMVVLENIGVKTTAPVLAAEVRQAGMVVNSWLLYEYLEGHSCLNQPRNYEKVINTLNTIHQHGFIHGDPQIRNFIQKGSDVYVIDANPKKASATGFDYGYEWAYLRKSDAGIQPLLDEKIRTKWYKFAIWYDKVDRKVARFRKKVKGLFGFRVS